MDRLLEKNRVRAVLKKMKYVRLQTDDKSVVAVHTESGTIAPLELSEVQKKMGVSYDEFVGVIKGMLVRIQMPEGEDLSIKECFGVILELADYLDFDGLCVAVHGLDLDTVDIPAKLAELEDKEVEQKVEEEVIEETSIDVPLVLDEESDSDDDSDWWL